MILTALFYSFSERFVVNMPIYKTCDLRSPPAFLVPLKQHNAPKGYECYISCAVKGDPKPRITWYRNNVSLNTNTNYYISNICGVCSLLILHVGPKDVGEYTIIAENAMGRAECSTKFSVRGERPTNVIALTTTDKLNCENILMFFFLFPLAHRMKKNAILIVLYIKCFDV